MKNQITNAHKYESKYTQRKEKKIIKKMDKYK